MLSTKLLISIGCACVVFSLKSAVAGPTLCNFLEQEDCVTDGRGTQPVTWRQVTKELPPGYFDFRDLPAHVQRLLEPSDDLVLCREWENAISYGKRRALGMSPVDAVEDIARARGERACRFIPGLFLSPVRNAIRGDNSTPMNAIEIIEWHDQRGGRYYTGLPKR
jgi:hypothetical protein